MNEHTIQNRYQSYLPKKGRHVKAFYLLWTCLDNKPGKTNKHQHGLHAR